MIASSRLGVLHHDGRRAMTPCGGGLLLAYDVLVFFDGTPIDCVAADEGAGVIEVICRQPNGERVRLEDDFGKFLTTYCVGDVEIVPAPISCWCAECSAVWKAAMARVEGARNAAV